ncbi:MAG: hypothetical protein P4K98_07915 [Bryobacteraceae bacterium]|nr:hypothetical protein [Bryobacteraceae bacterium]
MQSVPVRVRICHTARVVLILAASVAIPVTTFGQDPDPLGVPGKFLYHAESTYSPTAMLGIAAYAGVLQEYNAPREWGQSAGAYGKRFSSTLAWSGIHSTLAFGLDSTLHQDPRYFRSQESGFWRRTKHALRGTLLTRTDSGGETLSTWRIGSAYGAAFLSNEWYPDRLNTVRWGVIQGSMTLGFAFAGNLGAEFGPDIKRRLLRRK